VVQLSSTWNPFSKWPTNTRVIKMSTNNKMLYVKGKLFYCECGCNVFHECVKRVPEDPNVKRYLCNSCDVGYYGEVADESPEGDNLGKVV